MELLAIGTQILWRVSLRSVQVGSGKLTTIASIGVNGQTNSQNSMDTLQVDTTGTFILLTSDRVASVVSNNLPFIFQFFASSFLRLRSDTLLTFLFFFCLFTSTTKWVHLM